MSAPPLSSQVCLGNGLDWINASDTSETYPFCFDVVVCEQPEVQEPIYSLTSPTCDPHAGSCTMRADLATEFPGNRVNPLGTPSVYAAIELFTSTGSLLAACGSGGAGIENDQGTTRVSRAAACANPEDGRYRVRFRTCLGVACEHTETKFVDVDAAAGCKVPPTFGCGDGDSAAAGTCCIGPGGGAPAVGAGSATVTIDSLGGGTAVLGHTGAAWTLVGAAPNGMQLRYQFGGSGGPGYPENPAWDRSLGLYWSHDFAQRIVPAPDETHVWLVTGSGSYREFADPDGSGLYQTTVPADEQRSLKWLGGSTGWVLRDLNGAKVHFASDGLWYKTVDRIGRTAQSSYSGGHLSTVTLPDGRKLSLAYDPLDGKLASITETPVSGSGDSPRTWTYSWRVGNVAIQSLQGVTLPDGRRWQLAYDSQVPPHLIRVRRQAPTGSNTRVEAAWEYDSNGDLIRAWRGAETFANASAWDKYSWNYVSGSETRVTDAYGNETVFEFARESTSGKPRVTSIDGPCPSCGLGPVSTIDYDNPSNPGHPLRPWRITDADGGIQEFVYDDSGQTLSVTEALGTALERTVEYDYDPDFPALRTLIDRASVVPGCSTNRQVVRMYDSLTGRLESETRVGCRLVAGSPQSISGDVTHYDYAGTDGLAPTSIDPPGHGTADVTSFEYDETRGAAVLTKRTDPLVGSTSYGYDGFNRRTTVTDVNGVMTTTAYDAMDRVTSVTQHGATSPDDLVTSYFYNDFGDLVCTKLPKGNALQYVFDSAGRITELRRGIGVATPSGTSCLLIDSTHPAERRAWTLDAGGNRVNEKLQAGTNGLTWTTHAETSFDYTKTCWPDRRIEAPGQAEEAVTEYAYSCDGQLEKIWDPNHPKSGFPTQPSTLHGYDLLDRITTVAQPWGPTASSCVPTDPDDPDCVTVRYDYDVQDHLVEVMDGEGTVTSYVYSDRDLMTEQSSEVSGTTTYAYDEHRELVSETDARAITVTRTIDAADRVTFVEYPGTALDEIWTWGTNPAQFEVGRLESVANGTGTVAYTYDRFGRVLQDGDLTYGYDKNGNRTSTTYPGGLVATWMHDPMDREAGLSIQESGGPVQTVVHASPPVTYKPFGPLASLRFDLTTDRNEVREYDLRYAPTSIRLQAISGSPPTQLFTWDYTTDAVGNVTGVDQSQPSAATREYGYQDWQYFLACAAGPWDASASACDPVSGGPLEWTYDRAGNRLSHTSPWLATYGYQPNAATTGNTSELDTVSGTAPQWHDYTFDAAGYQSSFAVVVGGNPLTTLEFTFDDAGQLALFDHDANKDRSLWYDGRGFLSAVADSSGSIDLLRPTYSSEGVLHSLLREPTSLSPHRINVLYFAGRPIGIWKKVGTSTATLTRIVTDHLGTPVASIQQAGATLDWHGGFEPFGEDWQAGTLQDSLAKGIFLRMPGQWKDPLWIGATYPMELFYNVHRWYEPQTGRYTSVDPLHSVPILQIETPRSQDPELFSPLYGYAAANPLSYIDPLAGC